MSAWRQEDVRCGAGVIVEQPRAILLVYNVLEMISGLGIQFLGRA